MKGLGPLFDWPSGTFPERSRNVPETAPERSERIGTKSGSFPNSRVITSVPGVPIKPERISGFPNDSQRSDPLPLQGEESNRESSLRVVPTESSAALNARSQRTDSGDRDRTVPKLQGNGDQSPIGPVLRDYQVAAIEAVEAEWSRGNRRTLLVLPTGCGKTVVFAELARREVEVGGRVLVLAHRTELLEQAASKLASVGVRASIEQGDRRGSHAARVIVASVQSLRGARLERYAADAFAKIIVDEAHHAAAVSYRRVLERFPTARVLGVTATPDRGDGKALGKLFDSVAFTYEMRRAIREKHLAPLRARRITVAKIDLSAVRTHHGDFDQGELAKILGDEQAVHAVVGPLVELAGDRRTLVFGVDVAHAHALAEVINRHKPASAIAVDGSAKAEERAAALSLFRAGTFQFLVNCALFTEGFDEPTIACVAMARPTQSRALYTQMLGRGTRLAPGKTDCLVLDFVGNSRHRLIGPADALAGCDLDDASRADIAAALENETDVEDALVLAEEQAATRGDRRKLIAIAHYRAKDIDPFLGDHMPPLDPNSPAARKPATEKQLAAIEKAGLGKPPPGFTMGEASQVLDAIGERRRLGLATIPQARLLERLWLDTKGMTFARATSLIVLAKAKGWQPYTFIREPEFKRSAKRPA